MSLKEQLEQFGGESTGWFKMVEGDNPMRVLTAFTVFAEHFGTYKGVCIGEDENCEGCKEGTKANPKWLTWIHDKKDDQVKLAKFGYTIIKQLSTYQDDSEYAFSEYPMPYDITINAKGAGTKEVEYTVKPARTNTPCDPDVLEKVDKEEETDVIVEKMKDKKRGVKQPQVDYPEGPNPDDVPF